MQRQIAKELLSIGAVFLRPEEPFTWASGIQSPIYCDNRLTLSAPAVREQVEAGLAALVREQASEVMVLSTEACAICEQCAYPGAPCRHPDRMYPCVESHGIIATDIAEKHGIEFFNGNIVTWFSLIFFRE